MINENVVAGIVHLELGNDCTACRYADSLHAPYRVGEDGTEVIYSVKNFADDMEGGCVVRAADPEEDADSLATLASSG